MSADVRNCAQTDSSMQQCVAHDWECRDHVLKVHTYMVYQGILAGCSHH